jgi:hypothetical protein
MDLLHIMK